MMISQSQQNEDEFHDPMLNGSASSLDSGRNLLSYTIHSWSSNDQKYHPQNIHHDQPKLESSRWTSKDGNQRQFITIKLEGPCAWVDGIGFGKYYKQHVCNLKEFKVFGFVDFDRVDKSIDSVDDYECEASLGEENEKDQILKKSKTPIKNGWVELLHGGLDNNDVFEEFTLNYSHRLGKFPLTHLKIVPLAAWGNAFPFSIWNVKVWGKRGSQEEKLKFRNVIVAQAWKTCAQFMRNQGIAISIDGADENQKHVSSSIEIEHPILSNIYTLCQTNQFDQIEALLCDFFQNSNCEAIFQPFNGKGEDFKNVKWIPIDKGTDDVDNVSDEDISMNNESGAKNSTFVETAHDSMNIDTQSPPKSHDDNSRPCPRGGHQLAFDETTGKIWMFGGWNGKHDMNDLWVCDPANGFEWSVVKPSNCTLEEEDNIPALSAHSVAIHVEKRLLIVMGGYRMDPPLASQMGIFHLDEHWWKWTILNNEEGAPPHFFNGRICIVGDCLWTFGGIVSNSQSSSVSSSSENWARLHCLDLNTMKWQEKNRNGIRIPGRTGHSLLQHNDKLYIFGGQRAGLERCLDFYVYDCKDDRVVIKKKWIGDQYVPTINQRSFIFNDEIWVFPGMPHNTGKNSNGFLKERIDFGANGGNNSNSASSVLSNQQLGLNSILGGEDGDQNTKNTSNLAKDLNRVNFVQICNLKTLKWRNLVFKGDWLPRIAHQIVLCQAPPTCAQPSGRNGNTPNIAAMHESPINMEDGQHGRVPTFMLFGGNPKLANRQSKRLNDQWLCQPQKSIKSIQNKLIFITRLYSFYHLCRQGDVLMALEFLKTKVGPLLDGEDEELVARFEGATSWLLGDLCEDNANGLYVEIQDHFPEEWRAPSHDLMSIMMESFAD